MIAKRKKGRFSEYRMVRRNIEGKVASKNKKRTRRRKGDKKKAAT